MDEFNECVIIMVQFSIFLFTVSAPIEICNTDLHLHLSFLQTNSIVIVTHLTFCNLLHMIKSVDVMGNSIDYYVKLHARKDYC